MPCNDNLSYRRIFNTKNNSIAHYNSSLIELIIITGMILASLPFILFVKSLNNINHLIFDSQVKNFILLILISIFIMTLWLHYKIDIDIFKALELLHLMLFLKLLLQEQGIQLQILLNGDLLQ